MENHIAILGIVVQDRDATGEVNHLLHVYGDCIIGRMGLPHHNRRAIITIVMDCPLERIRTLSEELNRIRDIQVQTMMAKQAPIESGTQPGGITAG